MARQSAAAQERSHHGGHRGHGEQAQKKPCRNEQENPTRTRSAFLRGLCALRGEFVVLAQKDVKNEDRSDYVYENTDEHDIMSSEKHGFLQENATIMR
jgi:hypothetical protein